MLTLCERAKPCVCSCGQVDRARLILVAPGRTNHRLELFPLGCVEEPVTPPLEGVGGRFVEWEPVPRGQRRPILRPPMRAEAFTYRHRHHRDVIVGELIPRSWHTVSPVRDRARCAGGCRAA